LRPLHINIIKHHQAHWPPSLCVLRASTCLLFGRSSTRAAPSTCGADVRPQQDEFFMVTHCEQFFNPFSASCTPAWQMARAWYTRSPFRPARMRRFFHAASRTPRYLPILLLSGTRSDPATPRLTARTWWTPPGGAARQVRRVTLIPEVA